MTQFVLRVTAHESLGVDNDEVQQYADDFHLTPGELKFLQKAIEATIRNTTFFVYDDDVEPEPGVAERPREFRLSVSQIHPHD